MRDTPSKPHGYPQKLLGSSLEGAFPMQMTRLCRLSLAVAELCSLMVDLISEHSLVTRSRLGRRRDKEALGCGWEREAGEAAAMRPGFSGGLPLALQALPKPARIFTPHNWARGAWRA